MGGAVQFVGRCWAKSGQISASGRGSQEGSGNPGAAEIRGVGETKKATETVCNGGRRK